jgi:IS30 family transposase
MHKLSTSLHKHKDSNNTKKRFKIEERRRQVASLLAQSITESEIARKVNVDQSTISRDIKALKHMSQQFVFDLAKSDLAHRYQQCINGIEEVRKPIIKGRLGSTWRRGSALHSRSKSSSQQYQGLKCYYGAH